MKTTTQLLKKMTFVGCILTLMLSVPTSQAALIATDDFEDSARGSALGINGGTGWSAAWTGVAGAADIVAYSTAYTNVEILTTGGTNALDISYPGGSPAGMRAFPAETGDTLYFSCYFNPDSSDGSSNEDFSQFGFSADGTTPDMGIVHRLNDGDHRFGIRYGGVATYYTIAGTEAYKTYFLVFKASKSVSGAANPYNQLYLYIDPSTTNEPASSDVSKIVIQYTDTRSASYSYMGFRSVGLESDDHAYFDNIRIGTTWEDVVLTEISGDDIVEAPIITPEGSLFTNSTSVNITCATPGAVIHYTTDSTTPSDNHGNIYSGSISLSDSTRVMAIATKTNMIDSGVTEEIFGLAGVDVARDDIEGYSLGGLDGQGYGSGWLNNFSAIAEVQVAEHAMRYQNDALVERGGEQAIWVPNSSSVTLIHREFYPQNEDTLYLGYLFEIAAASEDLEDFFQIGFNDSVDMPAVSILHRNNTFGIRVSGSGDYYSSVTSQVGQVSLVVMKISKTVPGAAHNFNKTELFVNPSTTSEPTSATLTVNETLSAVAYNYFVCRNTHMESEDVYALDMIRIGQTYESVIAPLSLGTCILIR